MEALRSFFPSPADGAIGSLEWPPEVRKKLAKESLDWTCIVCSRKNRHILPPDDTHVDTVNTQDAHLPAPCEQLVVPIEEAEICVQTVFEQSQQVEQDTGKSDVGLAHTHDTKSPDLAFPREQYTNTRRPDVGLDVPQNTNTRRPDVSLDVPQNTNTRRPDLVLNAFIFLIIGVILAILIDIYIHPSSN